MRKITGIYKELLRDNLALFKAMALLFFTFAVVGFVVFQVYPDLLIGILNMYQDKAGGVEGLSLVQIIFYSNVLAVIISAVGGVFFGLPPLFVVSVNGFILGYLTRAIVMLNVDLGIDSPVLFLVSSLLPHGIIEIPIILIAAAVGVRLGLGWAYALTKNESGAKAFKFSVMNLVKFIPFMVVFLAVAAFIEVFVTGFLLRVLGY